MGKGRRGIGWGRAGKVDFVRKEDRAGKEWVEWGCGGVEGGKWIGQSNGLQVWVGRFERYMN